jgi:hypothetical protein
MPNYMPSRSDTKQGLSTGKKGRPKTKFGAGVDPAVSSGLKPVKPFKKGGTAAKVKTRGKAK